MFGGVRTKMLKNFNYEWRIYELEMKAMNQCDKNIRNKVGVLS